MTILKYGHCCLLIKAGGLTVLTDPGSYTEDQREARGVDLVMITHEHGDHFHIDSLKEVLANNPHAQVITNRGVGRLLDPEGIPYALLEHGGSRTEKGILLEGFGEAHGLIYPGVPEVINTGFFIENRFFYPGDNFTDPGKPVEILALPVAGPWLRMTEAIDYAKAVKPRVCFPVHDGMLKVFGGTHRWPHTFLPPAGIEFMVPEEGKEMDFS